MEFQVNFGEAASLAPPVTGCGARGFLMHGMDLYCLGEETDGEEADQTGVCGLKDISTSVQTRDQ